MLAADRARSASLANTAPHRSACCVCPCVGGAPPRDLHWRPFQDVHGALTADQAQSVLLAVTAPRCSARCGSSCHPRGDRLWTCTGR